MGRFHIVLLGSLAMLVGLSISAFACGAGSAAVSAAGISKATTPPLMTLISHVKTAPQHRAERDVVLARIDAELKRRNAR